MTLLSSDPQSELSLPWEAHTQGLTRIRKQAYRFLMDWSLPNTESLAPPVFAPGFRWKDSLHNHFR